MRSFLHVVGARPNFVKAAPLVRALAERGATQWLCHTGQHYDPALAGDVERDVGLPDAEIRLDVGAGTHGEQTARIVAGVEAACRRLAPDAVVVYGDVTSTLGAALAAAQLRIPVAHVEAGLRSRDRTMPEELNRRLVDHASDLLFATDEHAAANLRAEGLGDRAIHVVGNVMADSLLRALGPPDPVDLHAPPASPPRAIATLHRPESLDDAILPGLVEALVRLARDVEVTLPQHPRTARRLAETGAGVQLARAGVQLIAPLAHRAMARRVASARLVVTDSGGLQDECAVLGVPCVTLRTTTERPATVACGSNQVAGTRPDGIADAIGRALAGPPRIAERPPLWDGGTARRIAAILSPER